jgi:hypothetical protein
MRPDCQCRIEAAPSLVRNPISAFILGGMDSEKKKTKNPGNGGRAKKNPTPETRETWESPYDWAQKVAQAEDAGLD